MPHRMMVATVILGALLAAGAPAPAGAQVVDSARVPTGVERVSPLAEATPAGDGTLRVQLADARTTLVFRREP
jgi:hypothetical protein